VWTGATSKAPDAHLERYKAQVAEVAERRKEFGTARHESRVAVENAQIEILKGSVDRARTSASTIQSSATAIAGLYTGIAALVFSVAEDEPLPIRGIIPVVFLGLAVVLATAYVSWIGPSRRVAPFPIGIDANKLRVDRTNWFNDWVSISVLTRAWLLRLAALYLAAGLAFLPAAFVPVDADEPPAAAARPSVATTEWPPAPEADNALTRILYTAEVAEAATLRQQEREETGPSASSGFSVPEELIWITAAACLVGFAVVVLALSKWGALGKAINRITYAEAG
jgi:hypothetical protein